MRKEPNYTYLVVGLLTAVVVVTSAPPLSLLGILGVLVSVVSLLVTAYILTDHRRQLSFAVLLSALAFFPFAWFALHPAPPFPRLAMAVYPLNLVFWVLFTFYVGLLVFRSIIAARRVGTNEIFGAIYVYLLIGILFAQAYHLLLHWQPGALYFDAGRFADSQLLGNRIYTRGAGDLLYYSFVTLGTVGYGDVTPASPLARALSLVEAVIGIMYVATMIARFVSIQIGDGRVGGQAVRAEPPPAPSASHSGEGKAAEE